MEHICIKTLISKLNSKKEKEKIEYDLNSYKDIDIAVSSLKNIIPYLENEELEKAKKKLVKLIFTKDNIDSILKNLKNTSHYKILYLKYVKALPDNKLKRELHINDIKIQEKLEKALDFLIWVY